MLDVSRHFYTTDEVKELLDWMAFYKLNRFHWHLTDDHGWRIEIKSYPGLTATAATNSGSWRTRNCRMKSAWEEHIVWPSAESLRPRN